MSRGGVLFQANEALAPSGLIELMISWPVFLEGVCPLKLVMQGRVVRKDDDNRIAIRVTYREFRTARRQTLESLSAKGQDMTC
jgi:hypothetical protein